MALIDCPECSNKVSDFALSCPSCGCPIRESSMKPVKSSAISVIVSDFDMSFGKMVNFMVKAVIATIPAAIVLCGIVFALAVMFGLWGKVVGVI